MVRRHRSATVLPSFIGCAPKDLLHVNSISSSYGVLQYIEEAAAAAVTTHAGASNSAEHKGRESSADAIDSLLGISEEEDGGGGDDNRLLSSRLTPLAADPGPGRPSRAEEGAMEAFHTPVNKPRNGLRNGAAVSSKTSPSASSRSIRGTTPPGAKRASGASVSPPKRGLRHAPSEGPLPSAAERSPGISPGQVYG